MAQLQTQSHKLAASNPTVPQAPTKSGRTRIPMSVPQLRLAVPELPGFKLHWMGGSPARIQRALNAGYQFVDQDEVFATNPDLAGDSETSGSTDLGSHVSLVSGTDEQGAASRLYLMKLPIHLYNEDEEARILQSEKIASVIRDGRAGGGQQEATYVPRNHTENGKIFQRRT